MPTLPVAACLCALADEPAAGQSPPAVDANAGAATAIARVEALVAAKDLTAARAALQAAWSTLEGDKAAPAQLLERLATAAQNASDPDVAEAALARAADDLARTAHATDTGLLRVRHRLAEVKKGRGDLAGALAIEERVLSQLLERDDASSDELLRARLGLAVTKYRLGDARGALPLQEEAVRSLAKNLPEEAAALQRARVLLGAIRAQLGDQNGARELFEPVLAIRERTLPEDSPDLRMVREHLAKTFMQLGEHRRAEELLTQVLDAALRHGDADSDDVQRARKNLGKQQWQAGKLAQARDLFATVLAADLRRRSSDSPEVQLARDMLCTVIVGMGDHHDAVAILEQLLASQERTLPEDHPALIQTRKNLAIEKTAIGDLAGTLIQEEKILASRLRTHAESDPAVHEARGNLAVTKTDLGDLSGALALQEKLVAALGQGSDADANADLLAAWQNMAITRAGLGDLSGALALSEKVLAMRERTLDGDAFLVQVARWNVAADRSALGDQRGALALMEQAHAALSRQLSESDPNLHSARVTLALFRKENGDLPGAIALEDKALAGYARLYPADHPLVLRTRSNIAHSRWLSGDLTGAMEIFADLLTKHAGLPDDNPDLQDARYNLAWMCACAGDRARVVDLARQMSRAHRRAFDTNLRAPREFGALAGQVWRDVAVLASYVTGSGVLAPVPELAPDALLFAEACRGLETRTARLLRHGLSEADRAKVAPIAVELRRLGSELAAVGQDATDPHDEAALRAREDRRRTLVERRDVLQRELLALATKGGRIETWRTTADDLVRRLPPRSAAVSFLGYDHLRAESDQPQVSNTTRRLLALCLRPDRRVVAVPLGSLAAIEALVARLRTAAGSHGPGPSASPADPDAANDLRRVVVDPVLSALGEVAVVYVSLDEALQLVPLDALPFDDGKLVGTRVQFRQVVSLFDLCSEAPTRAANTALTPRLVAFGDLAYDEPPTATDQRACVEAPAPITNALRGGEQSKFQALPSTAREIDEVAARFTKRFPDGHCQLRRGSNGTRAELFALAAGARFLHLATHGYFAPDWVMSTRSGTDRFTPEGLLDRHRGAAGLSPFVLSGLALSGANLPPNEHGGHEGIATAEEYLQLDLSACELVVLSACDTSAGVRRAGQGYASLRAAFLGAGARHVVSSLWRVSDAATQEFMRDFYRLLWVEGRDPPTALWETKLQWYEARRAFRDWAGWVVTGK